MRVWMMFAAAFQILILSILFPRGFEGLEGIQIGFPNPLILYAFMIGASSKMSCHWFTAIYVACLSAIGFAFVLHHL